jgi:hypothetical protein
MAMLKLYNASVDFMNSESKMLGSSHPHRIASQNARVAHFVSNLRLAPKDVDDSGAAMVQLQAETDAFTDEQRRTMAGAISAHMATDSATDKQGAPDRQSNMFLQNYLPDTKWKSLYDKSTTVGSKLEMLVDFSIEVLGLRHPTDATLKILIGIVLLCHEVELSPDDFYEMLQDVKDKFTEKRPLIPGKSLLATYDRDPQQFMRLHPRQYQECDPPIASRLEERSIQQRTRKDLMPTRSTNKHLKKNRSGKGAAASTAATDDGGGSSTVAMRCLDFILGRGRSDAAPLLALTAPVVHPPATGVPLLALPAPQLALPAPVMPAGGAVGGAAPTTLSGILEQAKATLSKKGPDGAKPKKKARKNSKVPSTDSDEDDNEDRKTNSELKRQSFVFRSIGQKCAC